MRATITSLLGLAVATSAWAGAPLTLTHSGRLIAPDGAPVSGTHDVRVTLYDTQTSTPALWTRQFTGLPVQDGYFAVTLVTNDANQPLDLAHFSDGEVWVGTEVDGLALAGRQRLGSVPYALVAGTAAAGVSPSVTLQSTDLSRCTRLEMPSTGYTLVQVPVNCTTGATLGLSSSGGVFSLGGQALASCKAYRDHATYSNEGDGTYLIDPDGGGSNPAFNAYCDMTTDNGGWTLVMNVAPSDGGSVGYNNQAFWSTDAPYGTFSNRFANDFKSEAAYRVSGTQLMIQSAGIGASGSIFGWRRWPLTTTRTFDSFFTTGIVPVHGTDNCETGSADASFVGTTSSWDDIIRQGGCLYADVNPSSSGEGDTIRLTTLPGNGTDNNMSGFASCIDCGTGWQGSGASYMGVDRAGCNASSTCNYSGFCRVASADCVGSYCTTHYSTTSCGLNWNSRFYIR